MKRSLLAVSGLAVLGLLAGCATEADDAGRAMVGESRQDLAVGAAPEASPEGEGAATTADPTTPDKPQPEPWTNRPHAAKPAPTADDPRRHAFHNVAAAEGDDAPQPEPWTEPGTASVATNKQ